MAVHSKVVSIPAQLRYAIRPLSDSEWKLTSVTVNGPSFYMTFGEHDDYGNVAETEHILSDSSNLRTEVYMKSVHCVVFYNKINKARHAFYSAIDI
jgi:hypothetical protein